MTDVSGWGRYPRVDARVARPVLDRDLADLVATRRPMIARGLGRSYGDSAIADEVVDAGARANLIAFDEESGVLECDAGVSLDEILRVFVPRGWFLPVTPGTRHVTVGGAIASDVHGKNHHSEGTFGEHVLSMRILLGDGSIVVASPTEHPELFHATCGGMGLTGIVLTAVFRLKSIASSLIDETTIKAPDLDSVLAAFEQTKDSTYSVAWIDCLAKGRSLGRSLLTVGEHADSGPLEARSSAAPRIPIDFPGLAMNRLTMGAFNTAYYQRVRHARHSRRIPYEPFFYPLDILRDWNRMYGSTGFLQYQFVLPFDAGVDGMRDVLERIAASGRGSFLAVLKVFGEQNANLLSFPTAGYTLALDFQAVPAAFALFDDLDRLVQDRGGRLYLTKDARMSEAMFKATYPRWGEFEQVRSRYHAIGAFASVQSQRLGLA